MYTLLSYPDNFHLLQNFIISTQNISSVPNLIIFSSLVSHLFSSNISLHTFAYNLRKTSEDFFDGDSFSNYLDLFMMATPRNILHACLFLFFLETVSTVWNRGPRCPSKTSRQSSMWYELSLHHAAVSVKARGLPTQLTSFNFVKGPCSVQLEAILLCRGFFCSNWINCSVVSQITSPTYLTCQV